MQLLSLSATANDQRPWLPSVFTALTQRSAAANFTLANGS